MFQKIYFQFHFKFPTLFKPREIHNIIQGLILAWFFVLYVVCMFMSACECVLIWPILGTQPWLISSEQMDVPGHCIFP